MFVYNKSTREDFDHENLSSMHAVTSTLFQHSRLKLQSKCNYYIITAPNGLIAENPLVPNVPVPEVLVPGVGVPNAVAVLLLPNVKPVDPPPNKLPVVAAAILMK